MKRIAITLIVLAASLACLPSISEAACGRLFPGVRARRAAGNGLFQGNGPFRRAARVGGC